MIKARVYASSNTEFAANDTITDTYRVVFFGPELPQPDASIVQVITDDSDTLASAETKLVDAVIAEWNSARGGAWVGHHESGAGTGGVSGDEARVMTWQ